MLSVCPQSNATSHSDIIGDHLPEWLIGVVIVVIMLIIAFFAMAVTSFNKRRKNVQEGSQSSYCDDLESGAIVSHSNGETLQVTSFVYNTDNQESERMP
ncbi:hypothetical protein PoB_004702500, partial [Plakobranchus ocellatus]